MKATKKVISEVIRGITSGEEFGWPPECWGTFYQPERPVNNTGDPVDEKPIEDEPRA